MEHRIHITYNNSPVAWESQTAYWVVHLYAVHGINCYQTSECDIVFECARDQYFASMVITDTVKMV
jgi:hypothetical protein